jgi:phosphoenolpyruvate carboxykinase (ATP)
MKIGLTRALLNTALGGSLEKTPMRPDPVFGFLVPTESPGVPSEILDSRKTWSNPSDYDVQARRLAVLFQENFEQFKDQCPSHVHAAGPRVI